MTTDYKTKYEQLMSRYEKLEELVMNDPISGVKSRYYLEETSDKYVSLAKRGMHLAFVMFDVDHFKSFNDNYGHQVGDDVLKEIGAEAKHHFREGDDVCRYGGEEFGIIFPETKGKDIIERVEYFRELIASIGSFPRQVTFSYGVSEINDEIQTKEQLIQVADSNMYLAKKAGRNCGFYQRERIM